MKILAISNLLPRPDEPQRGVFNAQLFEAMRRVSGVRFQVSEKEDTHDGPRTKDSGQQTTQPPCRIQTVCLVPCWKPWQFSSIRQWKSQGLAAGEPAAEARGGTRTIYMPVLYLPGVGRSLSWHTYGWTMRELEPLARECAAVYSTWLYPDGVAATRLAAAAGVPSWIMVQGSDTFHLDHPFRRLVIRDACEKAAGIICVWSGLADRLAQAGVDEKKIHVVPNGADTDLFRFRPQEDARRQFSTLSVDVSRFGASIKDRASRILSPCSPLVLFVGHLVPVKGPDILLKAWAILLRSRTPTLPHSDLSAEAPARLLSDGAGRSAKEDTPLLVLLGDGPMRRTLEKSAARLGMADSVLFLGSRPHEEVALWMNVADCLCLTSRAEGMPNVVLEALASGLPIVATDVGAVPELLGGEPGARVVGTGECGGMGVSECIAAALADLLGTSVDRKAMAVRHRAGRTWSQQAEAIVGLIGKQGAASKGALLDRGQA